MIYGTKPTSALQNLLATKDRVESMELVLRHLEADARKVYAILIELGEIDLAERTLLHAGYVTGAISTFMPDLFKSARHSQASTAESASSKPEEPQ